MRSEENIHALQSLSARILQCGATPYKESKMKALRIVLAVATLVAFAMVPSLKSEAQSAPPRFMWTILDRQAGLGFDLQLTDAVRYNLAANKPGNRCRGGLYTGRLTESRVVQKYLGAANSLLTKVSRNGIAVGACGPQVTFKETADGFETNVFGQGLIISQGRAQVVSDQSLTCINVNGGRWKSGRIFPDPDEMWSVLRSPFPLRPAVGGYPHAIADTGRVALEQTIGGVMNFSVWDGGDPEVLCPGQPFGINPCGLTVCGNASAEAEACLWDLSSSSPGTPLFYGAGPCSSFKDVTNDNVAVGCQPGCGILKWKDGKVYDINQLLDRPLPSGFKIISLSSIDEWKYTWCGWVRCGPNGGVATIVGRC
jgi:hypothetical protein